MKQHSSIFPIYKERVLVWGGVQISTVLGTSSLKSGDQPANHDLLQNLIVFSNWSELKLSSKL